MRGSSLVAEPAGFIGSLAAKTNGERPHAWIACFVEPTSVTAACSGLLRSVCFSVALRWRRLHHRHYLKRKNTTSERARSRSSSQEILCRTCNLKAWSQFQCSGFTNHHFCFYLRTSTPPPYLSHPVKN